MKVISAAYGTGTVISQDADNVTVDFNGEVKVLVIRFARLLNQDGTPFGNHAATVVPAKKSAGQKRREKDYISIAAFNAQSNIDKIKQAILSINGKVEGDRHSLGYQIISERLAGIWIIARERGNTTIVSIIDTVEKYMRASEKQAYAIAKFADDNGYIYQ